MAIVRVLVVSDDPLARGGLAALLGGREDVSVAGQIGLDALDGAGAADVVAWDAGAGGAAMERIREVRAPVVALVSTETDAAEAIREGARGVLLRGASADAIAAALVAAGRGLLVLEPGLSDGLIRTPASVSGERLTPREREVLALLAEGLSNKAIAARLGISEHTAKFHVNAILGKAGAETRAEAIVLAARRGWLVL